MAKSITEWLAEGDELYAQAVADMHELEAQLAKVEERLNAKQAEVNRLGQIIGKPVVDAGRVTPSTIVGGENGHNIPNSPATIARALTGKGLSR